MDAWSEWSQYEDIQKKKRVHQVPALDQLVKMKYPNDLHNVRKSSKPKEFFCVYKCKNCGSDVDRSQTACYECATVCEESFYVDPSIDDMKYKSEFMHYSNIPCMYKRMNHFSEKLSQIQGKERTHLDDSLLIEITNEIHKMDMRLEDVNPKIVKMILKKISKTKYYEHCNLITHKINGYHLPQFTYEQEEKLKDMFNLIQQPFETHTPPGRKNFLNYAYIFRKFLELLSYDEYLPFFSELKSREKLYLQDEHWRKICQDLNWQFIPSL
tara:strand:- start:2128 stop:2934 length:807 start_codon:yes stop_codon:yes gene_type:complete